MRIIEITTTILANQNNTANMRAETRIAFIEWFLRVELECSAPSGVFPNGIKPRGTSMLWRWALRT